MLTQLALGGVLLAATVIVHTAGLMALAWTMPAVVRSLRLQRHAGGKAVSMVVMTLGLFALHGVEAWMWAGAYVATGALPDLPTALYFSIATFSTLGYGDIILAPEWRLFGSLEGINGFLLIGWSTAFLIAAATRIGPFRAGEHF